MHQELVHRWLQRIHQHNEHTSGGTAFSSGLSLGGTAPNGSSVSMTISGVTAGSITGYAIGDAVL